MRGDKLREKSTAFPLLTNFQVFPQHKFSHLIKFFNSSLKTEAESRNFSFLSLSISIQAARQNTEIH